ncbi:MAG TPA: nucleotidyltransferase family protein, partial [Pyrinomonadaceae bacterium]|nr:nucleotidyltransferase family protein [Pyrinomonadaceae bacterium]
MAESGLPLSQGRLLARLLSGAWRPDPPALLCEEGELSALAPLLFETGAAALAWWRVRQGEPGSSLAAVVSQLRDAYRLQTLRAAMHRRNIARVFGRLRAAGVEPLLVKGWAIARLYPDEGLRPYSDIDLCVRPRQYGAARSAIESAHGEPLGCEVDLHEGFSRFGGLSFDELYARSQLFPVGEEGIRVPGPEDHFSLLCFHLLREGAWRPLWLCDIALALESRPAGFDWGLCLGRGRRQADWVACAITLAHQLLDARLEGVPAAATKRRLPGWLVPSVLREWTARTMYARHLTPMTGVFSRPLPTLRGLRYHWPSPV